MHAISVLLFGEKINFTVEQQMGWFCWIWKWAISRTDLWI